MPEFCGWCGHTRAEHSRATTRCLVSSCKCYAWHAPPAEGEALTELSLVGHIEVLLDSVQEARDYLIASHTPTTGYPDGSVDVIGEWVVRPDRQAVDQVIQEIEHQRQVWGEDHDMNHSPFEWAAILAKYVGRYVDAVDRPMDDDPSRDQLIKIAAVAISAWITHATSGRP